MLLTAGTASKNLKELVLEAYNQERVNHISSFRGQGINIIISNTHAESEDKILYLEKFNLDATLVDSEPIYWGESRSFSNNKLEYFNLISNDASHKFYLT